MGQIGSAMTNPNTFAKQPSGFSGSEWAARFMGGAGKGLGQGLQGMQGQQPPQGGGQMPVPMPQQPQVQLPGMDQQQKARNPFFYGYGQ